jgi:hypothetical protein
VLDPFYIADLTSAVSVEFADGLLSITIWKPGRENRWSRRPDGV